MIIAGFDEPLIYLLKRKFKKLITFDSSGFLLEE
jgi:hypothetical protein